MFVFPWGREYRFLCPHCPHRFTGLSPLRATIEITGGTLATLMFVGFLVRATSSATSYVFVLSCIALFSAAALRPVVLHRNWRRNPPVDQPVDVPRCFEVSLISDIVEPSRDEERAADFKPPTLG